MASPAGRQDSTVRGPYARLLSGHYPSGRVRRWRPQTRPTGQSPGTKPMENEGQTWCRGRHRAIVCEALTAVVDARPPTRRQSVSARSRRECRRARAGHDLGDVVSQSFGRYPRQPDGHDHAGVATTEPDYERILHMTSNRAGRPAVDFHQECPSRREIKSRFGCRRSRQVKYRTRSRWKRWVKLRRQPHGKDHHSGSTRSPSGSVRAEGW